MILGLDVGGTNIDLVLVSNNKVIKTLKKEISGNLSENIFESIYEITKTIDKNKINTINLSTTIITNSIYLNQTNKVGLICQTGPGLPLKYLKITKEQYFVDGYIDHLGREVKDINELEIKKIKKDLLDKNIKDIAIVSKFATRNNISEEKIKNILKPEFENITLSNTLSGKLNFPRRINSAYLNASIKEIFNDFLTNFKKAMEKLNIKANINILKADGGIMDINYAKEIPLETILSGPAASLMGVNYLYTTNNDSIILDIGGTTTDIFFYKDGISLFEPIGITIKEYKTLIRAIYSKSISYGGDSLIKYDKGEIKLMPLRKDKAYGFGGKYITLTDALLYSHNLKSKEGIDNFSIKHNINKDDLINQVINIYKNEIYNTVYKYLTIINNKPVYTIEQIINYDKLIPKELILIGAPSNSLKPHLKDKFNLNVKVLNNYEIANAIGAAFSIPTKELNLYLNTKTNTLNIPEINLYKTNIKNYNKEKAKLLLINKLKEEAIKMGFNKEQLKYEITLEEEFNIVDGFYTDGINLRLKGQIKPGVLKWKIN